MERTKDGKFRAARKGVEGNKNKVIGMDNQELVKRLLRGISSYKALDERKYEFEYEGERYVIEPEIDGSFAIESGDVYDYTEDELPHILRVVNEMNSCCSNVKFICENNKIRISAIAFVAYSMHNQKLNFIEKERFPIVCESLVKDIVSAKDHLYYELPPKKGNGIKGKSWILWLILFLVAFFLLRSCFSVFCMCSRLRGMFFARVGFLDSLLSFISAHPRPSSAMVRSISLS